MQHVEVVAHVPTHRSFYQDVPPEAMLRQRLAGMAGVHFHAARRREDLPLLLPAADVYLGGRIEASLLRAARKLKWIHLPSAGVERALIPEIVSSEILLTNSRGVMAAAVADHTLACMLALARGLDLCARQQVRRRWADIREQRSVREVAGAVVGIVGYGSIGVELAARCKGLGMRVVGLRRSPGTRPAQDGAPRLPWERPYLEPDLLLGPEGLGRLLGESDYVVLAVPKTAETDGLIGEAELRQMRADAFLINVARGSAVDERALERALREGWIAGAALDVFQEEPLPPSHFLWGTRNLLVSPHLAGSTAAYWPRVVDLFVENLRRFVAGEPLLNQVDKARGY